MMSLSCVCWWLIVEGCRCVDHESVNICSQLSMRHMTVTHLESLGVTWSHSGVTLPALFMTTSLNTSLFFSHSTSSSSSSLFTISSSVSADQCCMLVLSVQSLLSHSNWSIPLPAPASTRQVRLCWTRAVSSTSLHHQLSHTGV